MPSPLRTISICREPNSLPISLLQARVCANAGATRVATSVEMTSFFMMTYEGNDNATSAHIGAQGSIVCVA